MPICSTGKASKSLLFALLNNKGGGRYIKKIQCPWPSLAQQSDGVEWKRKLNINKWRLTDWEKSWPFWSLWRAQTAQCPWGLVRPSVSVALHHLHPKSACLWSLHCPHRQWLWRGAGRRLVQWLHACLPCLSLHHPWGWAGCGIAGRRKELSVWINPC